MTSTERFLASLVCSSRLTPNSNYEANRVRRVKRLSLPILRTYLFVAMGCCALSPRVATAQSMWLSRDEVAALSTHTPAWAQLRTAADADIPKPDLSDQDESTNVHVLAKALVFARTGETKYRDAVVGNCTEAMGTEEKGRTLALGRKLAAYVIAADLVGFRDEKFLDWLRVVRQRNLGGRSLITTHCDRPNNWGAHCGASRIAVAVFLNDREDLERAAAVFRGWLGNRASYSRFKFDRDLSWQVDPLNPVPLNPQGAMKDGHSIDGSLPEDMRRGGPFAWPPRRTEYPWGALNGAVLQAELLTRQGYPAWQWEDDALLRAVRYLHGLGWQPDAEHQWMLYLVNRRYQAKFPVPPKVAAGKNMAWTNWTHPAP